MSSPTMAESKVERLLHFLFSRATEVEDCLWKLAGLTLTA